MWNDTSKSVSIYWYSAEGEAVWMETIPSRGDSYIDTYVGDKFGAFDESGNEDLLLMGGADIYTVSLDDRVRISKKRCAPFDYNDPDKEAAFRWAGCYSEGW